MEVADLYFYYDDALFISGAQVVDYHAAKMEFKFSTQEWFITGA